MPSSVPLSQAASLAVEVAPSFVPPDCGCAFHRIAPSLFDPRCPDLAAAAAFLSTLPEVYAVTPLSSPRLKNYLGAGFSQRNTKNRTDPGVFPRPFLAAGVDGSGTVVTVQDSPLDSDSTYFFDPAYPVENATLNRWHRKVIFDLQATPDFGYSEHGTHVCGTIAGHSPHADAAEFNGVAPGAKLARFPLGGLYIPAALRVALAAGSRIWSNSWSMFDWSVPLIDTALAEVAYEFPDLLGVWASGNEQVTDAAHPGGHLTVNSPGASKNVLAVGALAQLPVAGVPEAPTACILEVRSVDEGDSFQVPAQFVNLSRNPFFNGTTWTPFQYAPLLPPSVVSVATEAEVYALYSDDVAAPSLVISSAPLELVLPAKFPIIYVAPDSRLWDLPDGGYVVAVWQAYRPAATGDAGLAWFSSKGPSVTGIVKPDVVAPGQAILSARSDPGGGPDHAGLQIMQGTSMATPNVAGALALVQHYLAAFAGRAVPNPSAALLRAVIVNSADPLPGAGLTPTSDAGFGRVNLAAALPLPGADFALIVADRVIIDAGGHAVARLSAAAGGRLRVAVAYADPPGSADSLTPLLADLDLVVVAPSGAVFRGNQHPGESEEHFMTAERVVVDAVEDGEYEIHVFLTAGELVPSVTFAIAVAGPVTGELEFAPAAACLPCGSGVCSAGANCACPADAVGRQCQVPVAVHSLASPQTIEITVEPLEVAYLLLTTPGTGVVQFQVSGANDLAVRAYVGTAERAGAAPLEYGIAFWNGTLVGEEASPLAVLIRNDFTWPENYTVVASWEGRPDPTATPEEAGSKAALIAGIVVAVVVVAVAVGIGIYCYVNRDGGEFSLVPST